MKKLLVVVDMQKDFIDGSLGSIQAEKIVPWVISKIKEYKERENYIIFTKDTHEENYLSTQEGKKLPVVHCICGTEGWEISEQIKSAVDLEKYPCFEKRNFGSINLSEYISQFGVLDEIELCGLCSDICVVSNALILKAAYPETPITVDAVCCAGVTKESHEAALLTMKMCQINVINEV